MTTFTNVKLWRWCEDGHRSCGNGVVIGTSGGKVYGWEQKSIAWGGDGYGDHKRSWRWGSIFVPLHTSVLETVHNISVFVRTLMPTERLC